VAMKAKKYNASFRASAVRLAEESERPINEVARDLDIPYQTLYYWMTKARKAARPAPGPPETVEDENRRLRRELDEVKMERDFLKKAAAFFAKMNK
jgi:transposase